MNTNGFGWRDNPTNIKRQTPRKRINGFKLAAWCVVALLALLFVVMQLNPMHGETRTTYFVFGPDVRRGTSVQVVDGVPVTTPTVEVK
jgi:hypothetical protein